jgi:hypothetical protein
VIVCHWSVGIKVSGEGGCGGWTGETGGCTGGEGCRRGCTGGIGPWLITDGEKGAREVEVARRRAEGGPILGGGGRRRGFTGGRRP